MRTAIIADWLPVFGGAEHVIAELHTLLPTAPIYTSVYNAQNIPALAHANVHTSKLQKWYKLTGNHQWLLPFMPRVFENIDLRGYDTILSSSHAVAKGIVPPHTARHICYCHTPMRYAWEMEDEYLQDFRIPQFLRKIIKQKLKDIRRWDLTTAKRVDTFIANSTETQKRIQRIYNRDSIVITPPVSDRFFDRDISPNRSQKPYYLAIGRLVPYKRFDLLIQVANTLNIPLKIAGSGKEMERLKAMAGDSVEMLGFVPDAELIELYSNAKALLFPQFEDAGVIPIEAQASGIPVIAYGKGGVLDTVLSGTTGIFFAEQSVESITSAIQQCEGMQWDSALIQEHAKQFRASVFREKIAGVIHTNL